jgi:hypothetical protein
LPAPAFKSHNSKLATNTSATQVAPTATTDADVVDITLVDSPDAPADAETTKRGVLRLIEDGHFRGAAAARLRLNFFDQLDHTSLPPLPEIDGNGRGYAKFRAAYEARLAESNPPSPVVEPPATEDVPPTDGAENPPLAEIDEPPVTVDGSLSGAVLLVSALGSRFSILA